MMPAPSYPRRPLPTAALLSMAVVVCALQGCGTPPRSGAAEGPAPAARAFPLAIERQWLQSWFDGTPVRIAQRGDGPLSVEVPLEFSFDKGRTRVKPALAAVLDKVAESLRRQRLARLDRLSAPGDAAPAAALALQRATQVRRHLLSRGVPAAQIGAPSATTAAAVQLRIDLAPQ